MAAPLLSITLLKVNRVGKLSFMVNGPLKEVLAQRGAWEKHCSVWSAPVW